MKHHKPPHPYDLQKPVLFCAGSIAMGAAQPWQDEVADALQDLPGTLLNPRRDDWDWGWDQSLEEPRFVEQVEWELLGLEQADLIVCYFDIDTQSPVTLLELGLWAQSGKLLVCCPEGFWRKGNVDVVCRRYNVEVATDLEDLVTKARQRLSQITPT